MQQHTTPTAQLRRVATEFNTSAMVTHSEAERAISGLLYTLAHTLEHGIARHDDTLRRQLAAYIDTAQQK